MERGENDTIGSCLLEGSFVVTNHAWREMQNDNLALEDVVQACAFGEIIEDYPAVYPLPACLIMGMMPDGRPLHVCLSKPPLVKIITVYVPTPDRWEPDWKTRKVVR